MKALYADESISMVASLEQWGGYSKSSGGNKQPSFAPSLVMN